MSLDVRAFGKALNIGVQAARSSGVVGTWAESLAVALYATDAPWATARAGYELVETLRCAAPTYATGMTLLACNIVLGSISAALLKFMQEDEPAQDQGAIDTVPGLDAIEDQGGYEEDVTDTD